MDCKAQKCVTCGSGALALISHKVTDGNVFYTYRCEACGEIFSTETAYLARKAKEEKRAAMEQDAKLKRTAHIQAWIHRMPPKSTAATETAWSN